MALGSRHAAHRCPRARGNEVWQWAGVFRERDTNIDVEHHVIRQELRRAYDDARAWLEHDSYPPDEGRAPALAPTGPTRAATPAFDDVAELRNALLCACRRVNSCPS